MSLLRFTSALQVFEAFPTMTGEMTAPPADAAPLDYLAKLAGSVSPEDAITFSAYMLDKRQAVWWGARCLRRMAPPRGHAEESALLLAEAWVRDPEEHRRIAALKLGLEGDHRLAPVWLCLAAGCSGGTFRIGEVQGPPVPPYGTGTAARTAVLCALAGVPIRERQAMIGACVAMVHELLKPAEEG
jgi:hypothetical protein